MDKIQEAHSNMFKSWFNDSEIPNGQIIDHATITEEFMGKFAEWVNNNYISVATGLWTYKKWGNTIHKTTELINLFKQTL